MTLCGTPNYIAPEILSGEDGHSYEVDVWSLGVIIFTLKFGKPPFETTDVQETYQRIADCNYSFPDDVEVSTKLKDLIMKILVPVPAERLTIHEVLEHRFFHSYESIPERLPDYTLTSPPTGTYLDMYPLKKHKIKESGKDFERQQAQKKNSFKVEIPEGP